jgi:dipeptidyl aminopeptidase/acylaminoacyl peptidase
MKGSAYGFACEPSRLSPFHRDDPIMKKTRLFATICGLLIAAAPLTHAAEGYLNPPKAIAEVLDAPRPPAFAGVNTARTHAALYDTPAYPTLAELAEPIEGLAGIRFSPNNRLAQGTGRISQILLQPISPGQGVELRIKPPEGAVLVNVRPSRNGRWMALLLARPDRASIAFVDLVDGKLREIPDLPVNAIFGDAMTWDGLSDDLIVRSVPTSHRTTPRRPLVATRPAIQESKGRAGILRTIPDLLKSDIDAQQFEHFVTTQMVRISAASGQVSPVGPPSLIASVDVSPDGLHWMVAVLEKPFSFAVPYRQFAQRREVWNRAGERVAVIDQRGVQDNLPADGVTTGPRGFVWHPFEADTLVFVRALDGGNPKNKADFRDELLTWKAPFTGMPKPWTRTQHRFSSMLWLEESRRTWVTQYNRDKREMTHQLVSPDGTVVPLFTRNIADAYGDPGAPMTDQSKRFGEVTIVENAGWVIMRGRGASPQGDRPFLDRYELTTGKTERLFHSDASKLQSVSAMLDSQGKRLLVTSQSPAEPPNLFLYESGRAPRAITAFIDPLPGLRDIKRQRVTYERADGVKLSFTLYLPPGYDVASGKKLPALLWAYPLEFSDGDVAGQVTGSTNTFTQPRGASPILLTLAGYAVIMDATMPIVGDPTTVNDTFIKQVVDSAKAAIDKAATLGVDPDRVAVAGHSYGAFMTANLLAHSDLFRAGVARSGAYNRTLTPFGFQGERRTFWDAKDLYQKISPFNFAEKINEPILLIHGEMDDNAGTFPVQSERMYQALRGVGGNVRYVVLPHEKHGYRARESIGHVAAETVRWLDLHTAARSK